MRVAVLTLVLLLVAGCAPAPQRTTLASRWVASPNFDARRPNFVIVHHTGSASAAAALATLTTYASAVSAHYLIARDGTITQLVDERARAWHAGDSYWGGSTDLNSASIGIELDNAGDEPFPEAQITALLRLLRDVTERLRIPPENVLGHGDVAPGRKVDPSASFPWRRLGAAGFGLWCEPAEIAALLPAAPLDTANGVLALQALGYDVSRPAAAIAAYRRHFRGDDADTLSADDMPLLQCLLARKAARGATAPGDAEDW